MAVQTTMDWIRVSQFISLGYPTRLAENECRVFDYDANEKPPLVPDPETDMEAALAPFMVLSTTNVLWPLLPNHICLHKVADVTLDGGVYTVHFVDESTEEMSGQAELMVLPPFVV